MCIRDRREGREQPKDMPILAAWMQNLAILGEEVLWDSFTPVSYTHLRAHETVLDLVCRLLLEKKK